MSAGRRVLISGYYGAGNLGDEALLAGMIRFLRERGHRVEVLSANPARTRAEHGAAAAHRLRGLLPALARCEALISGGGGLLQDVTSRRSLDYYLSVIALARRLRKRVIVYGQSLGPLSDSGARRVARALRGVPLGLRDGPSGELARSWGLTATSVADAALALPPPRERGGEGLLLVPRGGHPAVTEALASLAGRARARGRAVACLPLHPAMDERPAREVAALTPGIAVLEARDPEAALRRIAAADFVVSGRLHGAVFAALAAVPHAGLAYDPKVSGFLAASGGASFDLPLAPASLDALDGLAEARAPLNAARREQLLRSAREGLEWLDARLREG